MEAGLLDSLETGFDVYILGLGGCFERAEISVSPMFVWWEFVHVPNNSYTTGTNARSTMRNALALNESKSKILLLPLR